MKEPWKRRKGETDKAFAALRHYLGMEKRSLRRVCKLAKTSYPIVSGWSKQNGWVARASAWDDHLASVQVVAAVAAARSTGETVGLALSSALEVARLVFDGYLSDPESIRTLKFSDVVDDLERLAKLDQLLEGRVTERVEVSDGKRPDLSDLWSTEEGRALLARAKSVKAASGQRVIA